MKAWSLEESSPVMVSRQLCQMGPLLDFIRGMERFPTILTTRTDGVMILGGIPSDRSWEEVASLSPLSVFLELLIGFSFSSGVWWVLH